MDVVDAPAKLTLSLRVTGVRGGRLSPARRRDGHARPRRHAHVRADGDGLEIERRRGRRRARSTTTNLVRRALAARRAARRTSRIDKRIPPAAGSAAARPTPPRSCAGPASTTSRLAVALGADVPFCLRGGRARVTGVGEVLEPLPARRPSVHAGRCRRSAARPRPSTGPGTSSAAPTGRRRQRPRARRARGRAAARRVARPARRGDRPAAPTWPGAARRGSSRGSSPATDGSSCVPQERR